MEIIYYAASSLDGYIATADGGVDWLSPFEADEHGLAEFYAGVDALIMGSATYEFALQHPPWQTGDKPNLVFTRRSLEVVDPSITLTSQSPAAVVETLGDRGLKRVWLMGGGKLAASFREAGLITHYSIALIPIVLGGGIPLIADQARHDPLELISAKPFESGIVLLDYADRRGGN